MSGETNLETLIRTMKPALDPNEYVFACLPARDWAAATDLKPLSLFQEEEGLTLIIAKQEADRHGIDYAGVFGRITLTVHSSLEAVGLTAAVAAQLTRAGISANVVAAYYHDHIFVPRDAAERALRALVELTQT
ncbi:ACT domain-containing protein [Acanthopleuribacter pedis]|uniref:ACT domain-containing protein n=1 Tax=Acanthopleuribacter pedis TaxID=442870 RepID=A0A8J7QPV7_9BACT|nr:ACT domain-containing protein [Acanthopleuribacter pedis]MBO1321940.1 ACT domain-containing protein [Acanthopleuribacter pedis]